MGSIFAISVFLFVAVFPLSVSGSNGQTDIPPAGDDDPGYTKIMRRLEEGVRGPIADWQWYWKEGFHIDSPEKNFTMKINLSVMVDGGYISADEELERAFPDLEGPELNFRQLKVSSLGTIYDWAIFKLDIDFANVRDIKDNWIQFTKLPYIDHFTGGHMKEPFSLEELTSLRAVTFMERALPTLAFSQGRNIGISRHTALWDQRMTWAAGAFLNTSSYGDPGETKDQISDANGWNITARFTYLPWYEEEGRRLLHLGLSYSHLFRDENDEQFAVERRVRPESRLTDYRLVDTGVFSCLQSC